jgi:hypothetical protein
MKKKVMTILLLSTTLLVHAGDYDYLTIESSDGSKTSLTAVGLTITFSDGKLVATNGSESATLSLSALSKMRFADTNNSTETAISSIDTTDDGFDIDDADAIYDLSGRQVPPTSVKKGIYIIKKGQETRKIQVK